MTFRDVFAFRRLGYGLSSALLTIVMLAGPAHAGDLCPDVTGALTAAEENFADWAGDPEHLPVMAAAEDCALDLTLSGARVYRCHWAYDLGAPAASEAFAASDEELRSCLGEEVTVTQDQNVNHPDFYDQRSYETETGEVVLSLKDKSALQQTYLFLQVWGQTPD